MTTSAEITARGADDTAIASQAAELHVSPYRTESMDERFCKLDALRCAILGRHVAVRESSMNLDRGPAFTRAQAVVNGLVAAIPGLIVALVAFGGSLMVAAIVKGAVARLTETRLHAHRNAGVAVGRLAQGLVILLRLLVGLSVALPTFRAGGTS